MIIEHLTNVAVYDYTPWVPGQVPPPMDEFVEFTPSLQHYKPVLWINDYWNLNKGKEVPNMSTANGRVIFIVQFLLLGFACKENLTAQLTLFLS
jgi:hypothetical protein